MKYFVKNHRDIAAKTIDAAITPGEGKLARFDGSPAIWHNLTCNRPFCEHLMDWGQRRQKSQIA
jgi:hypothetical protein